MAWLQNGLQAFLEGSWVINSTIAGSWMILAVLVLRPLLRRMPKWLPVALWGLVALRLLLPNAPESPLSLIPSVQTIPQELLAAEGAQLHLPARLELFSNPIYGDGITAELPQTIGGLGIDLLLFTLHWLAGMAVLRLYALVRWFLLRRRVVTAIWLGDNVYQSDGIATAFVLGMFRPRIILPYTLGQEQIPHVIAHEQAHIHRLDHWWKALGFLLLTLHWFNPMIWLAYGLFCRDVELACDEAVIAGLHPEQRADYTQTLVSCSVRNWTPTLAFCQGGVKQRVRAVLDYRKPGKKRILVGILILLLAAACFVTNPETTWEPLTLSVQNVTDQSLILVFQRSGTAPEMYYGNPYSLEQLVDGQWVHVEEGPKLFTTEAHSIGEGESFQRISWSHPLKPGRYRIGKQITQTRRFGQSTEKWYYAEFILP